ncbi:hypothetical protein [Mycolicibacterium komossense]|uniref:Uncharacterized protein n=1 Tax=Mycolicibacterium komossense TaxID=1779 RepID=A0ABT3CLZ2_9MYCO|nr:hypothetical protein [Mycolicibacterium komossense]MCV7230499.1 hypothetical protein [Mycolicibacterium komossense]
MRTMLMQPTAAALCAVCLAAPLAVPDGSSLGSARGHELSASAAAVKLAAAVSASSTALPANPTLLEVLGLPIQTINNIVAEGTTGALALLSMCRSSRLSTPTSRSAAPLPCSW